MRRRHTAMIVRLILSAAITVCAAGQALAQAHAGAAPKPPKAKAGAWTPPRTPWGDPDLSGVYTNNDESGIPFERPAEFEGRRLGDITEAELEQLRAERAERALEIAPTLGGAPGIHNPVHWFENFDAQNSRAWLVVDPLDGRIPPMTP